jgi:transposase InsO family protein
VEQQCQVAEVSRAGFYRSLQQTVPEQADLLLRREDNLLSLRRKKYVFTTDSAHTLPIYPNLARHAKLTALNQLLVADITFIRLRSEFIYLAAVLDAYSRRVVGWDLGRTLHAELATRALRLLRQPAARKRCGYTLPATGIQAPYMLSHFGGEGIIWNMIG